MADEDEMLALGNLFDREIQGEYGTLVLKQAEVGDVGCVVWDAAIVLEKYLETKSFQSKCSLKGKRVIELGAGTGLVGLVAAVLGADVICTDLPEILPLIQLNKTTNKDLISGSFEVIALKWGEDALSLYPPFDLILIADCIYYEESILPLIKTMCDLSGPKTIILLSYEERRTGNKLQLETYFFENVQQHFHLERIAQHEQDSQFNSDDIHIVKMTKML